MNHRNLITAGLALAALLVGSAAALAAPAEATASVNVRSGPGGNFKQVGKLFAGEEVDVTECQNGWCFVERDQGSDGWVNANYLAELDTYVPPPKPQPQPKPGEPQVNFGVTIGPDGKPTVQFGINQPPPKPQPVPKPPKPKPQPPTVCFYDKANFAGKSFCVPVGVSQPSLPGNWDDRISSIEVLNGATVDVCTEEDSYGFCATFDKSRAKLPGKLNDDISSFETY